MKNILTLVFALFIHANLIAQADIVALEYFVDDDPGLGLGSGISITSGQTIDISHSIDLSAQALSSGSHRLYIRARNANGDWSMIENRTFFILESVVITEPFAEDIVALEYFVDEDPGLGLGSDISITEGQMKDIDYSIDLSALSLPSGQHTVYVRAQNANGDWSMFESRKLFILEEALNTTPVVADIAELEYFIDEDPGQGEGTAISVSTSGEIDLSHAIGDEISPGWHSVHVRGKNSDGLWGFSEKRKFYIIPPVITSNSGGNITTIEYFFNEDPGIGNAGQISIGSAPAEVDLSSLELESLGILPVGMNNVYIRAQNETGQWSFSETREFEVQDNCTQPIVDFEVILGCAGEAITFMDMTTNLQGDATYRWYLDGNEMVDDTSASTSHTFENPGTYRVALAVHQGQICSDSLSMEITIKEKPIVVFSTNPVLLGEPTVFEVEQFYVDAGADWSWDFDMDTTEDDTTVGDNTFIFPSVGTYTTSLVITDRQGCGTTYTNSVEVVEEIGVVISNNEIAVYAGMDNTFPEITSHQIASIDLGKVDVGELMSHTFTIENTGSDELTISSIFVTDTRFSLKNAPVSVAALSSENFEVTISSSVFGSFSATVFIESDDTNEAIFLFTVSAEVTGKANSNLNFEFPNMTYGDDSFELIATSDSDSPITYVSSNDQVISISGTIASLMGAGACSIKAIQESNDRFPVTEVIREVTIQKKSLFVFADDLSKVFGASNPDLIVKYEGFVNGEGPEVLDNKPMASLAGDELSQVGDYSIDLSSGSDDNYEMTISNGELEVVKADLLIIADDQTKEFGDSNPVLTISYEGFVNDNSVEDITAPTIFTTAIETSVAGDYDIFLNGGASHNYNLTLVNGTMKVTASDVLAVERQTSELSIYPNPATSSISIKGIENFEYLKIYDSSGKLVKEFNEFTKSFSVSDIQPGLYTVLIQSRDSMIQKKLQKH